MSAEVFRSISVSYELSAAVKLQVNYAYAIYKYNVI
jgi:hypothetical protein